MKTILTLLVCLCVQSISAQTLPGLDPSFGKNGVVQDTSDGTANDIAVDQASRILAIGGAALFRYQANGLPDSTFGTNGSVDIPAFPGVIPTHAWGNSFHLLPDGKIMVADGYIDSGRVVRYLPDGQIDSSYGTNGMTDAPFNLLNCSALQPDGKLLVAGTFYFFPLQHHCIRIDRFTADGRPDSSFGTNGVVLMRNGYLSGSVAGMGVMSDGRIVLGGIGYDSNDNRSAMIIRLLPDGSPDSSLGGTGRMCMFNVSYCRAMLLQPDGKVLLSVGELTGDAYIYRLDTNGSIDSSFGQAGFASVPSVRITAMKLLPDDKLLCGGYDGDFVLARLLPDGASLDSAFGTGGVIRTDVSGNRNDRAYALAIQQDGKIILGGEGYGLTLVRYLPDAKTGIERARISAIRIYPNPAQNSIAIELGQTVAVLSVYSIYSMDGGLLQKGKLREQRTVIDISALAPGNYLLSVFSASFTQTQFFTKE